METMKKIWNFIMHIYIICSDLTFIQILLSILLGYWQHLRTIGNIPPIYMCEHTHTHCHIWEKWCWKFLIPTKKPLPLKKKPWYLVIQSDFGKLVSLRPFSHLISHTHIHIYAYIFFSIGSLNLLSQMINVWWYRELPWVIGY